MRTRTRSLLAVAAATAPGQVLALGSPASPARAATPITPTGWSIGAEQTILGGADGSNDIDSLYSTVQTPDGQWHGYVTGTRAHGTYIYDQAGDGTLTNRRVMLGPSTRVGAFDDCGAWVVGQVYQASAKHWIGFYHEEQGRPADKTTADGRQRCTSGHTRWRIRRIVTWDAGATWTKKETVISQDTALVPTGGNWPLTGRPSVKTDDAGSPRLVVRGNYMYLFYRAVNRGSTGQQMSVARAPLSSDGVASAWKKWYAGSYSQPGVGGQQSGITSLPEQARGISFNSSLNRYLSVVALKGGIDLYASAGTDLLHWTRLGTLKYLGGTDSAWKQTCDEATGYIHGTTTPLPLAAGYASIRGYNGGWGSGLQFYVYYMFKPAGVCMDHRYLKRFLVTLHTS